MADQHIPDNDDELDPFEEFLGGIEGDEGGLFDPTQVVFIRSTGGANVEVPIEEPMAIRDVLTRGGLTVSSNIEYWVDGVSVQPDHVVAPGATVTAVGIVKGG
jgi:hypothetical protein